MTDKDHFAGLDFGFWRFAVAADNEFAAIGKGHRLARLVRDAQRGHIFRRDFDQGHVLGPAALIPRL